MNQKTHSITRLKLRNLVVIVILFCCQFILAQSMSDFFKYEGAKLIGNLAHPTNTFSYANFNVYDDYVWMDIYYKTQHTELRIYKKYGMFTSISVLYDDAIFVSPFVALETMKDLVWDYINSDEDRDAKNRLEKYFDKTISEMSGKELACVIVTLAWADY